ncbi:TrkH family potassium uptake protein [Mammaliicoccus sp. Dog046]|uniref:TrkH family potassium uptake protein n=1 Tax=Mammaliicoccus sp. Dog046 TaxID=3034233 RepID=UPI002B2598FA|nr:TrkH family potassium uptake protein [Mammaliicoccus sp. Dog046]WQK84578.1 TrkH family potassium uptake protein [Mammaliicoccus sp. Dog046]
MNTMFRLTSLYLTLFLTTTLIGSVLLYIPITGKKSISFIDAFFIATSAFTVTGLSTVDIPNQFNDLGYLVILILIQIGGLGIVTLTVFILILSGKHITFKNRELLMYTWSEDSDSGLLKITIRLVIFSFIVEFIGAMILSFVFIPELGFSKGAFNSLFTSVSSFNNAGIALFSDNLMSYNDNLIINIIVPLLIIIGGLGYVVIIDIWKSNRLVKLKLHSKIVLLSTSILILIGSFSFWLLEVNHTLRGDAWYVQIYKSLFQSVSTRTAGFNTVDIGKLHDSTLLVFDILMFIGAAPMSTGGGIKVTTLTIILMYLYSQLKGQNHTRIFKRTLESEQISKAITVSALSGMLVLFCTFLILIIDSKLNMSQVLFEVISAFGTVGLSTGITADLSSLSKIILILLMIIGKIGVLIILSIFIHPKKDLYFYSKEKIHL